MADSVGLLKTGRKKKELTASRSFLQYGSTPLSEVNNGRLSLMSNARLQKITSNSLEKLSFISETDGSDNSDYENYHLAYSLYLLRKVQNRVLLKKKEEKEENVKKCFVSLKWELEGLLGKFVELSKGIGYFKILLEIIKDCESKMEVGRNLLSVLKENKFEELLKSLSSCLNQTINQLELIDLDKSAVEEMFSKGVWGSGSEIDECLKKIDSCGMKNKAQVSNIAMELTEIRKLCLENMELRERYCSIFDKFSDENLETNYNLFTDVVKKAFGKRVECIKDGFTHEIDILEFLEFGLKPSNHQHETLQLSNLDSICNLTPKGASTPHAD